MLPLKAAAEGATWPPTSPWRPQQSGAPWLVTVLPHLLPWRHTAFSESTMSSAPLIRTPVTGPRAHVNLTWLHLNITTSLQRDPSPKQGYALRLQVDLNGGVGGVLFNPLDHKSVLVTQLCLTLISIPFSRGSSQPRDWIQVSCTVGRFLTF